LFPEGVDKIRGEITPEYNLLRADRIQYIRKILPDARLVLIIHNPIDCAWSSYRRQGVLAAQKMGIKFEGIGDAKDYKYFQRHRAANW
jgi:hypothetical protein